MNLKRHIFAAGLLLCGAWLAAAEKTAADHTVEWQGVQVWQADSIEMRVIAFRNAAYPSDDYLPIVEINLPLTGQNIPEIRVENAEFIGLKEEERQLLEGAEIPDSLQVSAFVSTEQYRSNLTVHILPFVRQADGTIKKLSRYRLTQLPGTRSVASTRSTRHTYAANSVLRSGTFVKIRVSQSGIFRLTYEDLTSMGIPDPANVRIFGYGGGMLPRLFTESKQDDLPEVAIYMNRGADNVFNAGDYILFYAQGPVKWSYSSGSFTHETNVYSDYGYYFVTSDAGTGKKISEDTRNISQENAAQVTTFVDRQVHEIDAINLMDVDNGTAGAGREFFGEIFSTELSQNFSFSFPNIVSPSAYNRARISVAAASSVQSSFTLAINGTTVCTPTINKLPADNYTKAMGATASATFSSASDNLNVKLTYNQTVSTGKGFLNYIEICAERELKMSGNALFFQDPKCLTNSASVCQYRLAGANANLQVWNITDPSNIFRMNTTLQNDILQFYENNDGLQSFVALNPANGDAFPKPTVIGTIGNQNLHALNDIDFVIITHPTFQAAAERLAQAHREIDGMNVAVVTAEQVYNEFSSGTPDATAYRWIMKMLYDRANENSELRPPRYLLLFGDGSFDNRKLLSTSPQNWLLTYQANQTSTFSDTNSYVTDDYFAFLDDNEGNNDASNKMDIGVGRFCVNSATEADNVVTKTINYMQNSSKGIWKNQLCFLGDDGDSAADGILHMQQTDSIANSVGKANKGFQVNKILLDSYPQEVSASGESYPIAKNKLDNLLSNGMLLWAYCGHGGPYEITNEGMMNIHTVRALTNSNLPLWAFATCSFSKFDATVVSAGEETVLNPNGGSIGIFSASRTVFAAQNLNLLKCFCDTLFATNSAGEHYRIGDAIRIAKNTIASETNKRAFLYIGDPAVKLNFPTQYNIVTESINGKPVNEPDTMRALSTIVLEGHIADKNGQQADHFNGVVQLTVYDKEATYSSLNNNGHSAGFTFTDRQSTIFSGKANVEDGRFSITFMVPKDIKYNYGTGRINYYAYDTTTGEEGQGYFENFYVGGGSDESIETTEGPSATCYLNSDSFVSGDKVNETPLFLAYLESEYGINTSGAGIGHDVMLMIDNDPNQYYNLNNAFEAAEGDFRRGTVSYQLPELAEGKHTLTFRAWDLLNNSTTRTLEFEVVKGLEVSIYSVKGYPNPVMQGGTFHIAIAHDRPNTLLETNVSFYDLSGRLVHTQSGNAGSVETISCNLGQMGLAPGMYIYRVSIKTADSETTTKSNKIIVTGQ